MKVLKGATYRVFDPGQSYNSIVTNRKYWAHKDPCKFQDSDDPEVVCIKPMREFSESDFEEIDYTSGVSRSWNTYFHWVPFEESQIGNDHWYIVRCADCRTLWGVHENWLEYTDFHNAVLSVLKEEGACD